MKAKKKKLCGSGKNVGRIKNSMGGGGGTIVVRASLMTRRQGRTGRHLRVGCLTYDSTERSSLDEDSVIVRFNRLNYPCRNLVWR